MAHGTESSPHRGQKPKKKTSPSYAEASSAFSLDDNDDDRDCTGCYYRRLPPVHETLAEPILTRGRLLVSCSIDPLSVSRRWELVAGSDIMRHSLVGTIPPATAAGVAELQHPDTGGCLQDLERASQEVTATVSHKVKCHAMTSERTGPRVMRSRS